MMTDKEKRLEEECGHYIGDLVGIHGLDCQLTTIKGKLKELLVECDYKDRKTFFLKWNKDFKKVWDGLHSMRDTLEDVVYAVTDKPWGDKASGKNP